MLRPVTYYMKKANDVLQQTGPIQRRYFNYVRLKTHTARLSGGNLTEKVKPGFSVCIVIDQLWNIEHLLSLLIKYKLCVYQLIVGGCYNTTLTIPYKLEEILNY